MDISQKNQMTGLPGNVVGAKEVDKDGMPDDWERVNGLNPNNAEDRNEDMDSDGFTNLEEYINSLVQKR